MERIVPDFTMAQDNMNVPLLQCRGLFKNYGHVIALNGFDFEETSGKVHAILGENGAGKSTFIKSLSGAINIDSGVIRLSGQVVKPNSPRDAITLGIGVAYQELSLVPDLTVGHNIWLHLVKLSKWGTLEKRTLRERTLSLMSELNAPTVNPDEIVKNLSLASRQIVEILKVLAYKPSIVIFDEVTSSLPEEETKWILNLSRELAKQGMLVLFISHRLNECRQVADRVTVLKQGRAVLTGDMNEFRDSELIEAMLHRHIDKIYFPPQSKPKENIVMSVNNLTSTHRIRNVSFELREGEILGLGGLKGQGQSELLLALFGLLPFRGTIKICGQSVRITNPKSALKAGIGLALIPEDRGHQGLLQTKSIRENLALPILNRLSRWGFLSLKKEMQLTKEGIKRLNIMCYDEEQTVSSLSGGNQQKVVIAKFLLVYAKILLFHDITRGIDVGTKADIFRLTRELTASGYSIILYSSENHELASMCDRIIVLQNGSVADVLEGKRRNVKEIIRVAFSAIDEE